jgi:hypothetical protein
MKAIGRQFLIMVILWCKMLGSTFNALGVEYLRQIYNQEASKDEGPHRLPNLMN